MRRMGLLPTLWPMDIRRVTRFEAVQAACHLFDAAPAREPTERFLADEGRHLLLAYVDDVPAGRATGVEMTHPGKGAEMFLYELNVDAAYRDLGVSRALVAALARLARERGCRGLWNATGDDGGSARSSYRGKKGTSGWDRVVCSWTLDQR